MDIRKCKPSLRFQGFDDAWKQCEFKEIFNYERPDMFIVSNEEYSNTYSIPVLTANKGFILGYTNETRTYNKPCIIFDDFTLDSKYVDFPFMVKSSAMKILTNKEGFDLRFSHELLNSVKIENLGHARHYISVVQPTIVRAPKLSEQKEISTLFRSIDSLITLHQRKHQKLISIKQALLEKVFPKQGEVVPQIRFRGFADAWEQNPLSSYLEVSNEKNVDDLYTKNDVLSVSGDFGVVNQIEFQGRSFAGKSITNYGVLRYGNVVYTKSPLKSNPYGIIKANRGRTGVVSTLYAVYSSKANCNTNFVQSYFDQNARVNNYLQPLVNIGAKNDMKITSDNALKGLVVFPCVSEQNKIAELLLMIDQTLELGTNLIEKYVMIKKAILERIFVQ